MKKIILLLSSCLVILAACQSNTNNVDEINNNETTVEDIEMETNSGIYIKHHGFDWIDIETETGTQSYQLTEEAREDLKYLDEDDTVKFNHYHHNGKRMIEYIEKEEYFDQPRGHHEHHRHHEHHEGGPMHKRHHGR